MDSEEWLRCHWKPVSSGNVLCFCHIAHSELLSSFALSAVSDRKNKYPGCPRRQPQGTSRLVSRMLFFQICSILAWFQGLPSPQGRKMTIILEKSKLGEILFHPSRPYCFLSWCMRSWLLCCTSSSPCSGFCIGLYVHVLLAMSTQAWKVLICVKQLVSGTPLS